MASDILGGAPRLTSEPRVIVSLLKNLAFLLTITVKLTGRDGERFQKILRAMDGPK